MRGLELNNYDHGDPNKAMRWLGRSDDSATTWPAGWIRPFVNASSPAPDGSQQPMHFGGDCFARPGSRASDGNGCNRRHVIRWASVGCSGRRTARHDSNLLHYGATRLRRPLRSSGAPQFGRRGARGSWSRRFYAGSTSYSGIVTQTQPTWASRTTLGASTPRR